MCFRGGLLASALSFSRMDPVYKLGWHIFSELAHGLADFRIIGAEKLRILVWHLLQHEYEIEIT